jgi:integrator complex subunit 1
MQKILIQRNSDEYLRSLRLLVRDIVQKSRQDFDILKFTSELVNDQIIKQYFFSPTPVTLDLSSSSLFTVAGGLVDFGTANAKERYVHSICDIITVCILVAITQSVKDAYARRHPDTKEILTRYYMLMSQVQCDSVVWLQSVVRFYEINPNELIKCLFKILFMIEKPEQNYTIDNWPSEQERGILFRVVSEIPVLSETVHQVLLLAKNLPESTYMFMLCVEENLLKTAALVHSKDIYSLKLTRIEQFLQSLFYICSYKYQVPSKLVISLLYWKAWQILLILSALDTKSFGRMTWEQYPTLRLLMEISMTEDYNYPPQSSITEGNFYSH